MLRVAAADYPYLDANVACRMFLSADASLYELRC